MKYKVLGFILGMGMLASSVMADSIVTDRPDFTESTPDVASGMWHFENGYTSSQGGASSSQTRGEFLLRWGMSYGVEFRFTLPSYQINDASSGFSDAELGVKLEWMQANNWLPDSSLILQSSFATGADGFRELDARVGKVMTDSSCFAGLVSSVRFSL